MSEQEGTDYNGVFDLRFHHKRRYIKNLHPNELIHGVPVWLVNLWPFWMKNMREIRPMLINWVIFWSKKIQNIWISQSLSLCVFLSKLLFLVFNEFHSKVHPKKTHWNLSSFYSNTRYLHHDVHRRTLQFIFYIL